MSDYEIDSSSGDNFSELRGLYPGLTEGIEATLALGLDLSESAIEYPDIAYFIVKFVRENPGEDIESVNAPKAIVAQGIMLFIHDMSMQRTSILIPGDSQRLYHMRRLPSNVQYHVRVINPIDGSKPERGTLKKMAVSRVVQHRAEDGTDALSSMAPPGFSCITTPHQKLFGPMNHVVALGSVPIEEYN